MIRYTEDGATKYTCRRDGIHVEALTATSARVSWSSMSEQQGVMSSDLQVPLGESVRACSDN